MVTAFFYLFGLIDFIINKNNDKSAFEIKTNTNSCVKSILPGAKNTIHTKRFGLCGLTCKSSFHDISEKYIKFFNL